jgi:NADH-quinone oxidoreductase subunit B
VNDQLADKGFLVTTTDDLIQWARTRLADVDDVWPGLLRGGNDADASMPRYDVPSASALPRAPVHASRT